eukprot:TRINITY_DN10464_c0_g1_i1.p1 TRINITY_DN10464_c0_g1~~TRINITY_DN10464_c0_g1_i1.p1  ORF type:complete len:748 (+),score=213.32 TRINITY_DN10464_c0_g1_i1:14-2257(+)
MIRFKAINDEDEDIITQDGSVPTLSKEYLEAEATSAYEYALQLQSRKQWQDARDEYLILLHTPIFEDPQIMENKNMSHRPTILKYLALKNLGCVYQALTAREEAIECFIQALEIDASDVMIWHRLGCLAQETYDMSLARRCFEQALLTEPTHWFSLDRLVDVLFITSDYETLSEVLESSLAWNPDYRKGEILLQYLNKKNTLEFTNEEDEILQPLISEQTKILDRQLPQRSEVPVASISHKLRSLTWLNLGNLLLKILREKNRDPSDLIHGPVVIEIMTSTDVSVVDLTDSPNPPSTKKAKEPSAKLVQSARRASSRISQRDDSREVDWIDNGKMLFDYLQKFILPDMDLISEEHYDGGHTDLELGDQDMEYSYDDVDEVQLSTPVKKSRGNFASKEEEKRGVLNFLGNYCCHGHGVYDLMDLFLETTCTLDGNLGVDWSRYMIELCLKIQRKLAPYVSDPRIYHLLLAELYLDQALGFPSDREHNIELCQIFINSFCCEQSVSEKLVAQVRVSWLLGRLAQFQSDLVSAIGHFQKCRELLGIPEQGLPTIPKEDSISIVRLRHLKHDNEISSSVLDAKIRKLQTNHQEQELRDFIENSNYQEILNRLEPMLWDPLPTFPDSSQVEIPVAVTTRLTLLDMLEISAKFLGLNNTILRVWDRMLVECIYYHELNEKCRDVLERIFTEISNPNITVPSSVVRQLQLTLRWVIMKGIFKSNGALAIPAFLCFWRLLCLESGNPDLALEFLI